MTRVTKHTDLHGHSSHATRGLDFLEAISPKLQTMAERGYLEPADVKLLHTCASAIPSYVEDLSRCYGIMIERARLLHRYENWKSIEEPPDEGVSGAALYHFYGVEIIEETWWTGVWSERPTWATHYCAIIAPLGPPEYMKSE